jgi:hypothetical protein
MSDLEAFAIDHIHVVAFQLFPGRKAHRMNQDVIVVPVFAQFPEDIFDFFI